MSVSFAIGAIMTHYILQGQGSEIIHFRLSFTLIGLQPSLPDILTSYQLIAHPHGGG